MAIAPFDRILIPRLRQLQRRRVYARQLISAWEASLLGRMLPSAAAMPLPLEPGFAIQPPPNAAEWTLGGAIEQTPRLRLAGGLGSGRSLAIQQLLLGWAHGAQKIPATYPVLLHVPTIDIHPDEALLQALGASGLESGKLVVERGLAAGKWLLLIDDWEDAPPAKQALWRTWLLDLADRYPVLPAVITTADDDQAWPEFATWRPAPPTSGPANARLLERWLRVLLPKEEPSLMLGPLLNDERVQLVGERAADVITLALTYPSSGFPSNRAHLYATALDRALRPVAAGELPRLRTAIAALGYQWFTQGAPQMPASGFPPTLIMAINQFGGLIQLDAEGRVQFRSNLLALFCSALHLAASGDWSACDLDNPNWREIAILAAGLLPDPDAVYAAVRGPIAAGQRLDTRRTLLLGECLRQHHVPLPGWSSVILGALANLAKTDPHQGPHVWRLFERIPTVVGATLAEQLMSGAAGERWALAFLRMLPPHLSQPYFLDVISDSRLLRSTRRVAAIQLQNITDPGLVRGLANLAQRPLDETGRLLTTQLLSGAGPDGRRVVAELVRAGKIIFPAPADASDARIIVNAAAALLADQTLDSAVHTAASVALNGCVNETTAPSVLSACTAAAAPLREAARRAILNGDPGLALRAFGRLVLGDDVHWAARYEALQTLLHMQSPGSSALLARLLISDAPLAARIEAARALAARNTESNERLIGVLRDSQATPSLRGAIASVSAFQKTPGSPSLAATLLTLSCQPAPPPLRARVVRALVACPADEVLAMLAGIVEHERADLETLGAAIDALGALRDESGIWALRTILLGPLAEQLRAGWEAALDLVEREAEPLGWNTAALPTALRWRWGVALAAGTTAADPPTSLAELVAREVQGLRGQAAAALSAIGSPAARQALRDSLLNPAAGDGFGPAPAIAAELARLDAGADLAETIQAAPTLTVRWVAAQTLNASHVNVPSLRQSLEQSATDPQTRSAMLLALSNDPQVVPMLETLIVDEHAPLQLRLDAVSSLGSLALPHAEGLLLALLTTIREEPDLQVAALDILHPPISGATSAAVRQILRDPRPPIDVAAAALRCLVRIGDLESLPLFLRYAQHDSPSLATPAIDGLALFQDSTATALLSRLAHTSGKSTRIRLRAIGALLKIEGNVHLPLVRQLVESGSVSTRLLALDILLEAVTDPTLLMEYLNPATPAPLRIRLAAALAQHGGAEALNQLAAFLEAPDEPLALHCLALETLCAERYSPVAPLVEALARSDETPLPLRRRAIEGLRPWRGEPLTLLALSSLAEHPEPYIRSWALAALLD